MKPKKGIVYKITNTLNNKVYIGQTIATLGKRWSQHKCKEGCTYFHAAILKYGAENFTREVLEEVDYDKLDEREIFWIGYYKSNDKQFGYNLLKGGNLGWQGHSKLTDEQIEEMIQLDLQGVSHTELGKRFGINRKSVTHILRRYSDYKQKFMRTKDRDLEELKDYLIKNNPTSKEVVEKFNISLTTLFKLTK